MGSIVVDQIAADGTLLADVDTTLSVRHKNALLLEALPGATLAMYAGGQLVRFGSQVILTRQITHLGNPWPGFKKRIQIPRYWLEVERQGRADGLGVRFVGIYHYQGVTIFVDFDPSTYVRRKANNSAAHVSTNDLYQAQTLGLFSRVDRNGNRLTSVQFDLLAGYLRGTVREENPRLDVFHGFNLEFLTQGRTEALDAVQEMHTAGWPDRFQGEWAGFYLEYRLDEFVRRHRLTHLVGFQKTKVAGTYDYDLVFRDGGRVDYYGDLKASSITKHEAPGNDAEDIRRCIAEFGRLWYVIYEHDTWHARLNGDSATVRWNEWKQSVGYRARKGYDALSYAGRFKEAVHFRRMMILEVNEANFGVVLGDFHQGQQPGGADRAIKVMINKTNIDNFLIFSADAD